MLKLVEKLMNSHFFYVSNVVVKFSESVSDCFSVSEKDIKLNRIV